MTEKYEHTTYAKNNDMSSVIDYLGAKYPLAYYTMEDVKNEALRREIIAIRMLRCTWHAYKNSRR